MNSKTPDKSRFQVGLGVYVLLLPILAIILAFAYMKAMAPRIQQANVNKLIELGVESEGCYGVAPRILVWYEIDLIWDEAQQRHIIEVDQVEKYDYTSKTGDDYRGHPVAVEIFCNPDSQKLKEALKRLPSVRQVWISELKDVEGKITGNVSNRTISEWFPKRFIASPRHWGKRMDYKLEELP